MSTNDDRTWMDGVPVRVPLKVVPFPVVSLASTAVKLRELADRIEAGDYGEVHCCAVALLADRLSVFGFGSEADGNAATCVLLAGASKLTRQIEERGIE